VVEVGYKTEVKTLSHFYEAYGLEGGDGEETEDEDEDEEDEGSEYGSDEESVED